MPTTDDRATLALKRLYHAIMRATPISVVRDAYTFSNKVHERELVSAICEAEEVLGLPT